MKCVANYCSSPHFLLQAALFGFGCSGDHHADSDLDASEAGGAPSAVETGGQSSAGGGTGGQASGGQSSGGQSSGGAEASGSGVTAGGGAGTGCGEGTAECSLGQGCMADGDCQSGMCDDGVCLTRAPDCSTDPEDIPQAPGNNWFDSYSVEGRCYCDSTFDHEIGSVEWQTPAGVRTVQQICDAIGPGPGREGNPVYNDIQCGNGPANDAGDEAYCPGRVDQGVPGCCTVGPLWDLSVVD